jgi:hypothetical protein
MTILFAFGMPGVMSSWGVAALHAVAREAFGDYAVISTDAVEDLRQHVKNRTKTHAVLVSQFPEAKLSELILRVNLPFMLFLENPIDAVCYLANSTEQHDFAPIRAISASLACLTPLANAETALVMRRNDIDRQSGIDMLMKRIDEHFSIDLTHDQITSVLQHVGMAAPGETTPITPPKLEEAAAAVIAGYVPPQQDGSELNESLHDAIRNVLSPLEIGRGGARAPVSWPRATFFSGDQLGTSLQDSIDLTGSARCVIYGPYFHLPPGHWNAKLSFNIDEDCYGQIFTIEIFSGETLGKLRVCPEGIGAFEAAINVDIVEPKIPIEVRFMMDSGAIEGRLSGWAVEWQRAT